MHIKERARFVVTGAVFCAIVGPILGGLAVVVIRMVQGKTESAAEALAFFPMAVVFAAIPAAPFGFIVGLVGSCWLVARIEHSVSRKRLCLESAGIGAVLGATFPLILTILGWGPFDNLASALPISIGVGIVCGGALTTLLRKHAPLVSQTESGES